MSAGTAVMSGAAAVKGTKEIAGGFKGVNEQVAKASQDAADKLAEKSGELQNAAGNAADATSGAADVTGNAADATGNAADATGNAADATGKAGDAANNAGDAANNTKPLDAKTQAKVDKLNDASDKLQAQADKYQGKVDAQNLKIAEKEAAKLSEKINNLKAAGKDTSKLEAQLSEIENSIGQADMSKAKDMLAQAEKAGDKAGIEKWSKVVNESNPDFSGVGKAAESASNKFSNKLGAVGQFGGFVQSGSTLFNDKSSPRAVGGNKRPQQRPITGVQRRALRAR